MSFRIVNPEASAAPPTYFPNPDWQFPPVDDSVEAIEGQVVPQLQQFNGFTSRPEPTVKPESHDSVAFPYALPYGPSYPQDLNTSSSAKNGAFYRNFGYSQDLNPIAGPNIKQEATTDGATPRNLDVAAKNFSSFGTCVRAIRPRRHPIVPLVIDPPRRVRLTLLPPKRPVRLILTPPKKPKLRLLPPKRRVRLILHPPKPLRRSQRKHRKCGGGHCC